VRRRPSVEFGNGGRAGALRFLEPVREVAHLALDAGESCFDAVLLFDQVPESGAVERAGSMQSCVRELRSPRECGLVDPVRGEALGEDIDGGLFTGRRDEGLVRVSPTRHRHVEIPYVGWAIEEHNGVLNGSTLCSHAGCGVGEFDMFGHVPDGQTNGAMSAGRGDGPVAMNGIDGPGSTVANHLAAIGQKPTVVVTRCDLVTDIHRLRPGLDVRSRRVDLAVSDATLLASRVETIDAIVRWRHQQRRVAVGSKLGPSINGSTLHSKRCRHATVVS
jgi:hypothetical protein